MARTPPEAPSGQLVTAEAFNALRSWALESINIRVGPGLQMIRVSGGTFISLMHNPMNQIVGQAEPPGPGGEKGWFFAKIYSYTPCGSNQWSYGFREVQHTVGAGHAYPWTEKIDGIQGTAHNLIEHMNTGVGIEGNGVDHDQMAEVAPGFEMVPCPVGNIVIMYICHNPTTEGVSYWFQYVNADDGPCEVE